MRPTGHATQHARPPTIVFVLNDDQQGYGDIAVASGQNRPKKYIDYISSEIYLYFTDVCFRERKPDVWGYSIRHGRIISTALTPVRLPGIMTGRCACDGHGVPFWWGP